MRDRDTHNSTHTLTLTHRHGIHTFSYVTNARLAHWRKSHTHTHSHTHRIHAFSYSMNVSLARERERHTRT